MFILQSRAEEFKGIGLEVVVEPVDNGLLALQGIWKNML